MELDKEVVYEKLSILYEEYKLLEIVTPRWDLDIIIEKKKQIVNSIISHNIELIEIINNNDWKL